MHSALKIPVLANRTINYRSVKTWVSVTLVYLTKNVLSIKVSRLSTYWQQRHFLHGDWKNVIFSHAIPLPRRNGAATKTIFCRNCQLSDTFDIGSVGDAICYFIHCWHILLLQHWASSCTDRSRFRVTTMHLPIACCVAFECTSGRGTRTRRGANRECNVSALCRKTLVWFLT